MLNLVLPPDTRQLAALREAVRDWADQRGIAEWPLTLIVTELAANAMAVTPSTGTIEVNVADGEQHVEVSVTDPGPGFHDDPTDLDVVDLPPPSAPRGRGLFLVRQLSTELRARRHGDRTVVSAAQRRTSITDAGAGPTPTADGTGVEA